MIDFNSQQIRDSIAPVFQPPDTDYTGRMRDMKKCEAGKRGGGQYGINFKELSRTEIPPGMRKIMDAEEAALLQFGFEAFIIPTLGWEPGENEDPRWAADLPMPSEGMLYMCIKGEDLPPFAIDSGLSPVVINIPSIVWAYKENGQTFISAAISGKACSRDETGEGRPQAAAQNEGYVYPQETEGEE